MAAVTSSANQQFIIVIHFNRLQVCLSEPPFVFALLFIPSSTVVSGYFYVSDNMAAVSSVYQNYFDKFRTTVVVVQ